METIFSWAVLTLFGGATLALAVYGLHLYVLLFLFLRRRATNRARQKEVIEAYATVTPDERWPVVTSQIPIYNEAGVAERVIQAVATMDYPKGRHEVQVLDDSDDETADRVDRVAAMLTRRGLDVRVVRRAHREGYKAGALAHGLSVARGEFIAVFDADFVPPKDFLRRAVPLLAERSDLACLQGRWSHLNRDESWLTRSQALGIDGHFAIEQGARAWNGLMLNFNGTAGVWRRAAIDDPKVGGWSGDTLTEDLDLSYRAQLAGWKLDYCVDLPCPAELPGNILALKSQQRRWATGSIQVARKLLPRIWRSPGGLGEKLEATLHLTHYSVSLWMLVLAMVARPIIFAMDEVPLFGEWFWLTWKLVVLASIAPPLTYAYARYSLDGRWGGLTSIPGMFVLGCGLCLSNAIAVLRGLCVRGGEFVRTPKSGSTGQPAGSFYKAATGNLWMAELLLGVYSLACFFRYFFDEHRGFSVFLLIYAVGFLTTGWLSMPRDWTFLRREESVAQVSDQPALGS
ncbi:MAG: glycosyltransferase [Phycisphaerales bacterium]|nr:glycosyltransferase [Phycisphaerales bacterium]